jgi:L-2-hydroxyglutarate oxidase LhgO
MMYEYCDAKHIPYRRCGKLIVATSMRELETLDKIASRALACGVDSVERISASQASDLEPSIRCFGALHSPDTGIVDSHALMTSLLGDAERSGAVLALNSSFTGAHQDEMGEWVVESGGDKTYELRARWLFNCTGLCAPDVASRIAGFPLNLIPKQWLAKGSYFSLRGRAPFSRLIYPVPAEGGLGIHLTMDLSGRARFGPDVEWLTQLSTECTNYEVTRERVQEFEQAIREYWPDLPVESLHADYSGVRPKLAGPGQPPSDFLISGPKSHGMAGLFNLFGIESPGLTSSLAIASRIVEEVTRRKQHN